MGSLKDLTYPDSNVHLLSTNSNLAEIFVYDTLKNKCGASLESIIEVQSKTDFDEMLDLANIEPYLASKWLFVITYKKVRSLLKKYVSIFQSTTAEFLIKVDNYREFLEFKELKVPCNDLYLSVIRRNDIIFLLSGYSLSQKVMDFISKNYIRDVDKVFELKQALDSGVKIETTKDVIAICGESASSTVRFAFLLLNDLPTSENGLKRVYSKRIKLLNNMLLAFGPSKTYNFLTSTVSDLLDIKVLYLAGIIYDSVKGIPDVYDEKKLSRYSPFIKRITTDLSYERILRLLASLKDCGRWRTSDDAVQFIYQYYLNAIKTEVA